MFNLPRFYDFVQIFNFPGFFSDRNKWKLQWSSFLLMVGSSQVKVGSHLTLAFEITSTFDQSLLNHNGHFNVNGSTHVVCERTFNFNRKFVE